MNINVDSNPIEIPITLESVQMTTIENNNSIDDDLVEVDTSANITSTTTVSNNDNNNDNDLIGNYPSALHSSDIQDDVIPVSKNSIFLHVAKIKNTTTQLNKTEIKDKQTNTTTLNNDNYTIDNKVASSNNEKLLDINTLKREALLNKIPKIEYFSGLDYWDKDVVTIGDQTERVSSMYGTINPPELETKSLDVFQRKSYYTTQTPIKANNNGNINNQKQRSNKKTLEAIDMFKNQYNNNNNNKRDSPEKRKKVESTRKKLKKKLDNL